MQNQSLIARIAVLALLFYGLGSLTAVWRELDSAGETVETLRRERERLTAQQQQLSEALARRDSPEEQERLARERLGMVRPGERVFIFDGA